MTGPADRRRSPRVRAASPAHLTCEVALRVQVRDLSASGALLVAYQRLTRGQQGLLELQLGATRLVRGLRISRVVGAQRGAGPAAIEAGSVFGDAAPDGGDEVERVLEQQAHQSGRTRPGAIHREGSSG